MSGDKAILVILPQALGQVGVVKFVLPDSDLRVSVNGKSWTMNSQCVVPMAGVSHAELEGHVGAFRVQSSHTNHVRSC